MSSFAAKHDLCATPSDERRIKRQLGKFYKAVEAISDPGPWYIQLYDGDRVREAFAKTMRPAMALDAAIAMAEMPDEWPTEYRASVAFHLSPLLSDVVNS